MKNHKIFNQNEKTDHCTFYTSYRTTKNVFNFQLKENFERLTKPSNSKGYLHLEYHSFFPTL